MCLIGAIGWVRGTLIFFTEILAGIASAGVVSALFPSAMKVRTTLRATSVVRGLFIEMFLTTMLVFTVFMLAAEKHKSTFLAPIGIGLALFIAELSGASPSPSSPVLLLLTRDDSQASTTPAARSTRRARSGQTSCWARSTATTGSTGRGRSSGRCWRSCCSA